MHRVPIVQVTASNAQDVLPSLMLSIKTSSFIGLDLELSGLGNRKLLKASNIEERYKNICEVANSRSILALGISCFKLQSNSIHHAFLAQSFNIVIMCQDNYIVEPPSINFLLEHHFDFNKQLSQGLPYYRGHMEHEYLLKETIKRKKAKNKAPASLTYEDTIISTILKHLITSNKAIVMHNALVDLVFLYCSFYAPPPGTLAQFLTDCHLLFPGGIYDTKVLAEFQHHMQASYLDYVFKKCQRENAKANQELQVSTEFVSYSDIVCHYLIYLNLFLLDDAVLLASQTKKLCSNYADHGWCSRGAKCPDSHCVDLVLCYEESCLGGANDRAFRSINNEKSNGNDNKVNKNNYTTNKGGCMNRNNLSHKDEAKKEENGEAINNSIPSFHENKREGDIKGVKQSGSHGAGIDAFMTAYSFACFVSRGREDADHGDERGENKVSVDDLIGDADHNVTSNNIAGSGLKSYEVCREVRKLENQVYLCGKDITLRVVPSQFSKPSPTNLKLLAACKDV